MCALSLSRHILAPHRLPAAGLPCPHLPHNWRHPGPVPGGGAAPRICCCPIHRSCPPSRHASLLGARVSAVQVCGRQAGVGPAGVKWAGVSQTGDLIHRCAASTT